MITETPSDQEHPEEREIHEIRTYSYHLQGDMLQALIEFAQRIAATKGIKASVEKIGQWSSHLLRKAKIEILAQRGMDSGLLTFEVTAIVGSSRTLIDKRCNLKEASYLEFIRSYEKDLMSQGFLGQPYIVRNRKEEDLLNSSGYSPTADDSMTRQ